MGSQPNLYAPQAANFDPMYGRKDIYDDKGRFIGREGGITREDPMGAQLSNFNKLQGLMENGADGMTGLQALSAQAMGQYNAGAHTMGDSTYAGTTGSAEGDAARYQADQAAAQQQQQQAAANAKAQADALAADQTNLGTGSVSRNREVYGNQNSTRAQNQATTGRADQR
jgi:hypothetical protein